MPDLQTAPALYLMDLVVNVVSIATILAARSPTMEQRNCSVTSDVGSGNSNDNTYINIGNWDWEGCVHAVMPTDTTRDPGGGNIVDCVARAMLSSSFVARLLAEISEKTTQPQGMPLLHMANVSWCYGTKGHE